MFSKKKKTQEKMKEELTVYDEFHHVNVYIQNE